MHRQMGPVAGAGRAAPQTAAPLRQ